MCTLQLPIFVICFVVFGSILNIVFVFKSIEYEFQGFYVGMGIDKDLNIPDTENHNELLHMIESINLDEQIKRINKVSQYIYHQLNYTWIPLQKSDIINTNKSKHYLMLTSMSGDIKSLLSMNNLKHLKYAYISKLRYCQIHDYLFLIDTFDYLSHFNLNKTTYFSSPTKEEMDNITNNKLSDCKKWGGSEVNATDSYQQIWKQWIYYKQRPKIPKLKYYNQYIYDNISKTYNISRNVSFHFNKILSVLYWSQFFDIIVKMDDDAFIGNYHLTIDYWLQFNSLLKRRFSNYSETKQQQNNLLIFPYDTAAMEFSNFAFILNTQNKMRSNQFILNWFEHRKIPYLWDDQGALYIAIMDYLLNELNYIELKRCFPFCAHKNIMMNLCYSHCLKNLFDTGFRPIIFNGKLKGKQYDFAVNDKLLIQTPKVITNYDILANQTNNFTNYTPFQYDYQNIYPFSLNFNWLSMYEYTKSINRENEKEDLSLRQLNNIYLQLLDSTFIIHWREQRYVKEWEGPKKKALRNIMFQMDIFQNHSMQSSIA